MADKKPQSTTKKVLKFMFIPSFSGDVKRFSFIRPLFIGVIAGVLEQANLIRKNHPAINMTADSHEDVSLMGLMSEAYGNMKMRGTNSYQVGVYGSVCLMLFAIVASIVTAVVTLASAMVSTSSAQLFSHPTGVSTGMDGVTGSAAAEVFNRSITQYESAGMKDWGIILLNKLFREGIAGSGGALQNSFGTLMQVFNSAILVMAGIMLFWSIIVIIVDTAKTGTVGGGRHNMVWAPIRIVTALALLIPLGTSGFSAGQLLVIKTAEWGSNLGTTAWYKYVQSAAGVNMVSGTEIKDYSDLIKSLTNIYMCQVTSNSTNREALATGATPTTPGKVDETSDAYKISMISPIYKEGSKRWDKGMSAYFYTIDFRNRIGDSCGTVEFPGTIVNVGNKYPAYLITYANAVKNAYLKPYFADPDNPEPKNFGKVNSSVAGQARKFACSIATLDVGANYLKDDCDGWSESDSCGASIKEKKLPGFECYHNMYSTYGTVVGDAINSANQNLAKALDTNALVASAKSEGWPSMGWWYFELYKLNNIVMDAGKSPVTITVGAGPQNDVVAIKWKEVNARFSKWWESALANDTSLSGTTGDATKDSSAPSFSSTDATKVSLPSANPFMDVADVFKKGFSGNNSSGGSGFKFSLNLGDVIKNIFFAIVNAVTTVANGVIEAVILIFTLPVTIMYAYVKAAIESDNYPIIKLARIGAAMMDAGSTIYKIQTVLLLIGSIISLAGIGFLQGAYNLAQGIVMGPIGELTKSVGMAMMTASLLPLYYVPMLPFIKVAFAVLAWLLAVFETVVLMPVAALSHINTKGDGFLDKSIWGVWVNMLFRPIMVVIGFIGSIIVFNTFVVYFNVGFSKTLLEVSSLQTSSGVISGLLRGMVVTTIYCSGIYMAMNITFNLIDKMPSAFAGYLGISSFGADSYGTDRADLSGGVGKIGHGFSGGLGGLAKSYTPSSIQGKEKEEKGGDKPSVSEDEKKGGKGDDVSASKSGDDKSDDTKKDADNSKQISGADEKKSSNASSVKDDKKPSFGSRLKSFGKAGMDFAIHGTDEKSGRTNIYADRARVDKKMAEQKETEVKQKALLDSQLQYFSDANNKTVKDDKGGDKSE